MSRLQFEARKATPWLSLLAMALAGCTQKTSRESLCAACTEVGVYSYDEDGRGNGGEPYLALTPGGGKLAVAFPGARSVNIYSAGTVKPTSYSVQWGPQNIGGLEYAGEYLALASARSHLRRWKLDGTPLPPLVGQYNAGFDVKADFYSLATSPDGRALAAYGGDRVWSWRDGARQHLETRAFEGQMYTGYLQVAMGQQSDWILAAGADPRKAVGTLLWHVPSGRTRVVPGVGWPAAISRDRFAAWDPKKKSIVTMDLESAQVISTLAVDAPPTAMCLAGGHFLLHSDARQDAWKLRIKRLSDGEELQVIRSPDLGDIASAFYSPDCKAIGFATRRLAGMAFWTARLDRLE